MPVKRSLQPRLPAYPRAEQGTRARAAQTLYPNYSAVQCDIYPHMLLEQMLHPQPPAPAPTAQRRPSALWWLVLVLTVFAAAGALLD